MSRVLRLPIPAKSTQLLGKDFVGEEGRGANLVDIGNGLVVVRIINRATTEEINPAEMHTLCQEAKSTMSIRIDQLRCISYEA